MAFSLVLISEKGVMPQSAMWRVTSHWEDQPGRTVDTGQRVPAVLV